MFYRLMSVLVLCMFMGVASSAADKGKENKQAPLTKEEISKIRENIGIAINIIKKTVLKGKNGEGKPLISLQLKCFANAFDYYVKADNIEKTTRISRGWFKKCRDALKLMYKPKADMDTAILNRNKKAYKEAELKYQILLKKFTYLIKHPEKAKKIKRKKRSK